MMSQIFCGQQSPLVVKCKSCIEITSDADDVIEQNYSSSILNSLVFLCLKLI